MDKKILALCAGVVLLAGCSEEVMQPRQFVPTESGEVKPVAPMEAGKTPEIGKTPAKSGAKSYYEPMNYTPAKSSASKVAASGEYTVKAGDTMGKIAIQNHVKLSALLAANGMDMKSASKLRIGQKLVIPSGNGASYSGKSANKSAKSGKNARKSGKKGGKKIAATTATATVALGADGTYEVKSGDTPERIARKLGVKLNDLMKENNMTQADAKKLRVGQKLRVPGKSGATTPAGPTNPQNQDNNPPINPPVPGGDDQNNPPQPPPVEGEQGVSPDAPPAVDSAAAPVATPDTTSAQGATTDVAEATQDCTVEEFAAQHNCTAEEIRKLNSFTDKISKGEYVIIPIKK